MALTLAVFVVGPSLDAMICHDELSAAASAFVGPGEQVASYDDAGTRHPVSSPHQPCVHGHCHHSFQSALVSFSEVSVTEGEAERRAWPTLGRLATLSPPGLERPPRA